MDRMRAFCPCLPTASVGYHAGMCLIAFHWNPESDAPLLIAANRDEFYARPTAALAWWDDQPILAGRDLQGGGTWMGLHAQGRFAALTNYRDPAQQKANARSRGELVVAFLASKLAAADFIAQLRSSADEYLDFNLLIYDGERLLGYESRFDRTIRFGRGIHAISNAQFDTPWPKVEALKLGLSGATTDDAALFKLLADDQIAPDARLPQTGVPLEWERALSAAFIRSPSYGTRSSSVVRLSRSGARMTERRFDAGVFVADTTVAFTFSPPPESSP